MTFDELVAGHPGSRLPCPVCAASVRADNLRSHASRVHGQTLGSVAAAETFVVGKDGLLARRLAMLLVVVIAIAAILITLGGGVLPGSAATALIGTVFGILCLMVVAALGVFRARLTVTDRGATLRFALGALTRRIEGPLQVDMGSLWTTRRSAVGGAGHHKIKAGSYVRLVGRSRITIRCKGSTDAKKHWDPSGWRQGKSTRLWDITVDRPTMVAIEYALVRRGVLRPRAS